MNASLGVVSSQVVEAGIGRSERAIGSHMVEERV